jgi:hypothetical protein
MTKPQLDPKRFHRIAAEYRALARRSHTKQEKTELLNLAERLTALAQSQLWKPQPKKAIPEVRRSSRRTFKFASDAIG